MRYFVLTIFFVAVIAVRAVSQDLLDSLSFAYSLWSAEQRKMMLLGMQLSEPEKSAFVPVYDDYARIAGVLEVERLQLLYQDSETPLTDEDALVKRYEKILQKDLDLARLRKQYYKKFRRVLSSARANEFMALDESLRAFFYMELQLGESDGLSESVIFSLNGRYTRRHEAGPTP